ncbi:MAG: M48 family metalloprotease [Planctomycetota bacterium]|jgi:predicted Zn-dependent protease
MRLLLPLAVLAASCANQTDPVTGEGYYSPIGNDYASQLQYVRSQYLNQITTVQDGGDLHEPEINRACEEVFRKVLGGIPSTHKRDFEFDLTISAGTHVNAYTYGAGFIRCNVGLVAFCDDASELAGILAHELGHNSHDHIGQTIGRTAVSSEVLGLGGVLGRPGALIGHLAGGGAAAIVLTRYSRAQETQADERAVDYTLACGYDPDGLARFFGRLDEREKRLGRPPQLFLSHPYSGNRVADIRARITDRGASSDPVRQTDSFRRAIERARVIVPYYERLNKAVESDDKDAALAAAQTGAAALPHHPAFHFWAGAVLFFQEKPEEAVLSLRRADSLDKTNFLVPLVHATLELETGHPKQAEQAATKLIGLMPVLPQGYLIRGMARYAQQRKEEAFTDFRAGLDRIRSRRDRRQVEQAIRKHVPDFD